MERRAAGAAAELLGGAVAAKPEVRQRVSGGAPSKLPALAAAQVAAGNTGVRHFDGPNSSSSRFKLAPMGLREFKGWNDYPP